MGVKGGWEEGEPEDVNKKVGGTEAAEKKEGVEVEVMVVAECGDGGELVMCWEGEGEPDGGLREELGIDEDEKGWRRARSGGVATGEGEGGAGRAGGVLVGLLALVGEEIDSCGGEVCFDIAAEGPGGGREAVKPG